MADGEFDTRRDEIEPQPLDCRTSSRVTISPGRSTSIIKVLDFHAEAVPRKRLLSGVQL
jgi:hypothetical protein